MAPSPARVARRRGATAAGWLIVVVGTSVLVGWAVDLPWLTSIVPAFESMKPFTALALLCLGGSLCCIRRRPVAGSVLAAVGGLIGATMAFEYVIGAGSGLDTLLFGDVVREGSSLHPGRMAPMTAWCVSLSGLSLTLAHRGATRWAHRAALASLPVAGVALVGYLYDVESLRRVGPYASVALHTSVALALLDVAIVLSLTGEGLTRLARRGRGARVLVHQALPIAMGAPLLVGWLRLAGQEAGWYDTTFGLALMAIACSMIGTFVLWRGARAIAAHEDGLEETVRTRTLELAELEAIQRSCLDALEQGVALFSLDGRIQLHNRAGREVLGYSPEELGARFASGTWETYDSAGRVLPIDERPLRITMLTGEPTSGTIVRWRHRDGRLVPIRVSTEPLRDDAGKLTGVVFAFADVSAELAVREVLEASRSRFAALVEQSADLVAILDSFGVITYVSPSASQLDLACGEAMWALASPADHARIRAAVEGVAAESGAVAVIELDFATSSGDSTRLEAILTNRLDDADVAGIVVNARDITARSAASERLRRDALHDALTRLANRAGLSQHLTDVSSGERRSDIGALYIDLDGFKAVNDSLGHAVGDELLIAVADRLRHCTRDGEVVARLGGDEFVIVMSPAASRTAQVLAARVVTELQRPFHLSTGRMAISASVGVALTPNELSSDLLKRADEAMYLAKERGRNRFEMFAPRSGVATSA